MFHLLVATTNPGKVAEIKALLRSKYIKISSLVDFPEYRTIEANETGASFAENALIKARLFGRLTGLTTLADDSGLSVKALDNHPGIHSKRYAATDSLRISKLLDELKDVLPENRQAFFTCAMVLYDPSADKFQSVVETVDGVIATQPQGNNGFGYDPIFFCPSLGCTFGQASPDQKNQISHRAKALEKMKKIISKRCR